MPGLLWAQIPVSRAEGEGQQATGRCGATPNHTLSHTQCGANLESWLESWQDLQAEVKSSRRSFESLTKSHHTPADPRFLRTYSSDFSLAPALAGIATRQPTRTPPTSAPSRSRRSSTWITSYLGSLNVLTGLTVPSYIKALGSPG